VEQTTLAKVHRSRGRLFLALGLLLALAGVIVYAMQVAGGRLSLAWYLPVTGTLGVILVLGSLWQRRTILRVLALLFVLLLAAGEWMLLLERLPPYSGPVQAGQPFPPFATLRADGTSFTQRDLEGEKNNVLVFFRGRW
jgi:hypothetical protein